ncbi:hypothetical protein [Bowmanella dokdonensis]|uniref:Uncharacterized protein n=1 Tax=Bowmanella dokdonensis TaxID=751969 RepID=A0A939DP85_9ALTE|nr:hypothetical protein [Bowmanella dokdonensis]MBN7825745.1 hypothetical protein [Bowmanella dokdonensis]
MKRTIVLILEIAVLVVVLRSSFVQFWLADIQDNLSDWMTELATMAEREALSDLQKRIRPFIANLSDYQREYIMDITSSRSKLEHFQRYYCIEKDKNPYVYGATLIYLCSEIRKVQFD